MAASWPDARMFMRHPVPFVVIALIAALADAPAARAETPGAWDIGRGDKGLEFRSPGGNWIFNPWLRLQFRYSEPYSGDPLAIAEMQDPHGAGFELKRSRLKMDVQLGTPVLTLYSETQLEGRQQLDFRVTYQPSEDFWLRVGQWKAEYNRERRDSSGEQQFVDRSVVTRDFTLDRQQGVMAYGRMGEGSAADLSAWVGVFGGAGRGRFNDGGQGMQVARLQWNPNGEVLEFSQSDLERRPEPVGSVAIAAARDRSRYTRFSSDGGGELTGYERGEVDQYEIEQYLFETALQWRGFSWQQEWHHKTVEDRLLGGRRTLRGLYAQAGYFPHERWEAFPRPLEVALRYATVDDGLPDGGPRREYTLAGNWYFKGHLNKINLDVSRLEVTEGEASEWDWRTRLQWDVSF